MKEQRVLGDKNSDAVTGLVTGEGRYYENNNNALQNILYTICCL